MVSGSTRVIQVTNIAPQATKDQMQTLFGYLGKIDDIRLYPTIRDVSCPVQSRICYVKYYDSSTVNVAQHMTNTVFIDRALIVMPMQSGEIPDEHKALELSSNGTLVPGLTAEPRLPAHVVNTLEGLPPNQVIQTHDPKMVAAGLPAYPPLPAAYDARKMEEIRRTVLAIDVGSLTHTQLIEHFGKAGEVKYLRFCTREEDKQKYALIEMTEQESVIKALQLNNSTVEGQTIKVLFIMYLSHSYPWLWVARQKNLLDPIYFSDGEYKDLGQVNSRVLGTFLEFQTLAHKKLLLANKNLYIN